MPIWAVVAWSHERALQVAIGDLENLQLVGRAGHDLVGLDQRLDPQPVHIIALDGQEEARCARAVNAGGDGSVRGSEVAVDEIRGRVEVVVDIVAIVTVADVLGAHGHLVLAADGNRHVVDHRGLAARPAGRSRNTKWSHWLDSARPNEPR